MGFFKDVFGLNPSGPNIPDLSPQLLDLYNTQRAGINQQGVDFSQMQLAQMGALGYVRDPGTGAWTLGERGSTIRRLLQERQIRALQGGLEISPALDKQLREEEKEEKLSLLQDLGPDYMNTTAGSQRLSNLQQRHSLVREFARRGDITGLETMLGKRRGQTVQGLLGIGGQGIQQFSATQNALQGAGVPFRERQQALYRGDLARYQTKMKRGDWYRTAIVSGMAAWAACSSQFKENISGLNQEQEKEMLKMLEETQVYSFQYKPEVRNDNKKHIGIILEDAPKQLSTPDGKQIDTVDFVGLAIASIKQLSNRIKILEQQVQGA